MFLSVCTAVPYGADELNSCFLRFISNQPTRHSQGGRWEVAGGHLQSASPVITDKEAKWLFVFFPPFVEMLIVLLYQVNVSLFDVDQHIP